ncbi:MAG TPA: UDP-N-acetylmuramate dehydrogenase [candidate division Zixibacteria bacterium]|nr:UDP-N-acetylmuramate dehydrogenase [candidate division Zixibacteria bacterium]
MSELVEELRKIPGLTIRLCEPLAPFTSIKIGGPADYLIEAGTEEALARLLPLLRRHGTAVCFLGNGSNVLVSDLGVRGAVIRLSGEFRRVRWDEEGETVRALAGAGCAVTQLVREAARRGYAGLEFAEGIPGSVGGALAMNAGAYGSEFERLVDRVEGLSAAGERVRFERGEMRFAYRESNLPPGMIVTRVVLRLAKEDPARVSSRVRELVQRRRSSQPAGHPNSGSMFRNPPGDFAGRLVEAAGLKGKRIGQSQISEKHANFIVNLGGAKAAEVRRLMELAQAEVKARFGVELQPEVRFLGEWPEGKPES